MSLEQLPAELQCSVIRLLDPIGLVSISQSNTHFRRLVSPNKKHFAERLLALESLPIHGGITPIFRSRDNDLTPGWANGQWESMRWACTDCLRLLPHKSFDNHSLLRLGYRKPIPGSHVANALTTWEPVGHMGKSFKGDAREKTLGQRYFVCVTSGRGRYGLWTRHEPVINRLDDLQACGMVGFQGLTQHQFDKITPARRLEMLDDNAFSIELERCGNNRRLRKCNECRYKRGESKPRLTGPGGTLQLPIFPSRQIVFGTHVDRFFPGFSEYLDSKKPSFDAPMFRIYRQDAHDQLWTMWMVRCPGCARWQEMREFRLAGVYQHWKPEDRVTPQELMMTWDEKEITESLLNEASCNMCFAEANGRHELGKILRLWVKYLIGEQIRALGQQLMGVCSRLKEFLGKEMPIEYHNELKHLLRSTACLDKDMFYRITYSDVATLKLRWDQWRDLWERMKTRGDTDWTTRDLDEWNKKAVIRFDKCEAHWRWLMACMEELEEKPEALVEWALARDGASFT
ncbi:hypothetical protein FZEAL_4873 [Fusarium zealandicum]|uniref:F-box domain-containing protein n=1 Tax=Fusarium zealandicum TaxID=1053134 RepID=A0A8H4XLG2_9HYPO|nr:hypothetical protein FZEAL_4873 [Fusarium zealandicum]